MTEQEVDNLLDIIKKGATASQKEEKKEKKGVFSKLVVCLCILLAIIYTGFCIYMQYVTGTQPEPQLTISFFGFVTIELWNLSKIKRDKERRE